MKLNSGDTAEDLVDGLMSVNPACYNATRYTAAATNTVKSSAGVLHSIIIGTTAAATITVKDGNTTLIVFKASMPEGVYPLNIKCSTSIVVVTAGSSDITVVYR